MRYKITALFLIFAGCELLGPDRIPPTCAILYPTDSTLVSGVVNVEAEARDSSGIASIEFYADGTMFARESSERATAEWDTRALPEGSWHKLFCIATDRAGNRGTSDTVELQILQIHERNVFHGEFTLADRYYRWVEFSATPGETLTGAARTATAGTLSRFLLVDQTNFNRFRNQEPYTALFERQNLREFDLTYGFTTTGIFYLIFVNTTGTTQTYWARFAIKTL